MNLDQFLDIVKTSGPEGIAIGLVVLVIVYAISATRLVVTGTQKRIVTIVFNLLLGGVSLTGTTPQDAMVSAIAMLASSGLYELIQWAARRTLPKPE